MTRDDPATRARIVARGATRGGHEWFTLEVVTGAARIGWPLRVARTRRGVAVDLGERQRAVDHLRAWAQLNGWEVV